MPRYRRRIVDADVDVDNGITLYQHYVWACPYCDGGEASQVFRDDPSILKTIQCECCNRTFKISKVHQLKKKRKVSNAKKK